MAKKKDEATSSVRVRWLKRSGVRIVDDLRWDAANDYTAIVDDPVMVSRLLANGGFALVADVEPGEPDGAE